MSVSATACPCHLSYCRRAPFVYVSNCKTKMQLDGAWHGIVIDSNCNTIGLVTAQSTASSCLMCQCEFQHAMHAEGRAVVQAVGSGQVEVLLSSLTRGSLALACAAVEALMQITIAVQGKQAMVGLTSTLPCTPGRF